MIDPTLLNLLACPQCNGEVRLVPEQQGLVCDQCRLRYAIRNGIPVMLIDEAEKFPPE
ncbi:MAG: Trm112 family protein [Proteobacteria bacterium]|nr:Trm112 family protein [Pseudomonadota bacterium]MBU1686172.1 Trm112 family protein [Pseudomonadota bacterium]